MNVFGHMRLPNTQVKGEKQLVALADGRAATCLPRKPPPEATGLSGLRSYPTFTTAKRPKEAAPNALGAADGQAAPYLDG